MPNPTPEQLDALDALSSPKPAPGFREAKTLPQPGVGVTPQGAAVGISPAQLRAGVAVFDTAGRDERQRLERRETPLAPVTPVSADYDARFSVDVRVSTDGTITRVAPASGLQPGEQAGLLPRSDRAQT